MRDVRAAAVRRSVVIVLGVLAASGAALAMQGRAKRDLAGMGPGERLVARLETAKGGETITLAPGEYGVVKFPARTYVPAITLMAGSARFTGLVLKKVEGVSINGGTVTGPGGRSYGVLINGARNITVEGMTITGAHRGIVLGRSDRVRVSGNTLTGLLSDGIDVSNASNVVVRGNTCRDFSPRPTTFDAAGKRLTVGDHPDCIQGWSRPPTPMSDVLVENNDMEGKMQGVFFGNHVRNGVNDGGYDRIIIRNNRVRVTHPNGIVIYDARDSIVTGNTVSTYPGPVNPRSGRPNRSNIRVKDGVRTIVCGNRIADFPNTPPTRRCR